MGRHGGVDDGFASRWGELVNCLIVESCYVAVEAVEDLTQTEGCHDGMKFLQRKMGVWKTIMEVLDTPYESTKREGEGKEENKKGVKR